MCNSCKKQKCICDNHLDTNLLKQLITEYTAFNQFVLEFQDLLLGNVIKDWNFEESYPQDVVVSHSIGGHNYLFRAKKNNEGNTPSLENNEFWEVFSAEVPDIDPDPYGVQNFTVEDGNTPFDKILTITRTDATPLSIVLNIPDSPSTTALPEIRYGGATTADEVPSLNVNSREPAGWTTEPPSTPFVWMTSAVISQEDNTLLKPWASPSRLTGLPGAPGAPGQDGQDGKDGQDGAIGDGVFKSQVFYVSETEPATPAGGSWLSPVPTTPGWSDGIPDLEGPRWMSTRIFTLSGAAPQQVSWTQPKLLADSADVDIEFSSVVVNPGNPTDNPENWSNDSDSTTEWMAIRKYANGEWGEWKISKIKGENGLDGNDGQDGQDGQDGTGYEFQYTVTNRGDSPPSVTNDVIWSSTFPGTIDSSQTLWYRQRTVTGTSTGVWVGPIKMTGRDGESIEGPSMAYRGDWSAIKEYSGSPLVVDVVKYAGLGYIARTDAGEIPVGTLPTDTDYWNEFTENIDSLFADFLFAYSGYIQNLTVGVIQTAVPPDTVPDPNESGERFTAGKVLDTNVFMSNISKHAPYGTYPSGRPGWTIAYIDESNSFTINGVEVKNTYALIFFKDEEGSPIHASFDAFSPQVNFNVAATSYYSYIIRPTGVTDATFGKTQSDAFLGALTASDFRRWNMGSSSAFSYSSDIFLGGFEQNYRAVQGSDIYIVKNTTGIGSSNWVNDGWYLYLITPDFTHPDVIPEQGVRIVNLEYVRVLNGKIVDNYTEKITTLTSRHPDATSYPGAVDQATYPFLLARGEAYTVIQIENNLPRILTISTSIPLVTTAPNSTYKIMGNWGMQSIIT